MWANKAEFLRDRGGMAMIDTHPDYLIDERIFSAYARFLDRFAEDPTAWQALPREVSAWWRRRAASWLEHDGSRLEDRRARRLTRVGWRSREEARESRPWGHRHRWRLPGPRDRSQPRRRGVDVVVIDDERSISRHSRYVAGVIPRPRPTHRRTDRRRSAQRRERRDVEGWVVYPTREETVAALSRQRPRLLEHFRIPTPDWSVTQWAWDKRNTYARAAELGIPVPRCWHVSA